MLSTAAFVLREKRYMIRHRQATGTRCLACLLEILMLISLAGCASWTSPTPPPLPGWPLCTPPTPPPRALNDVPPACQVEVMQADPTDGVSESNQYDAYIACLHDKGW